MRKSRDGMCANAGCENAAAANDTLCFPCRARVPASAPSEPDLFSPAPEPAKRSALPDSAALNFPPHQVRSPTSAAAAESVARQFPTQLKKVLDFIQMRATTGATRAELANAIPMRLSSVCSAVRTLYRMGLIGSNPGATRIDPSSNQRVEILVSEAWVDRWRGTKRRDRSMLDGAPCDLAVE